MPKDAARDPQAVLRRLLARDRRYDREAYQFLFQSLDFTLRGLDAPRHVTAAELLDGLRRLALKEFGLLARMVLGAWGIKSTRDVGELVYNLVDAGLMRVADGDRREDFDGVFDFEQALWEAPRQKLLAGEPEA
ncbi:MAG: hypothetical protein HZA54_17195 [Planctomycetes bacterium]|nr:hypothetical protein [Planctomycetota bacterium]